VDAARATAEPGAPATIPASAATIVEEELKREPRRVVFDDNVDDDLDVPDFLK
jgi:hypothetical protein